MTPRKSKTQHTPYPIDKHVPFPSRKPPVPNQRNAARQTLLAMEVGDSIFCNDRETRDRFHYALNYMRRTPATASLRFALRLHETGWRVWRID